MTSRATAELPLAGFTVGVTASRRREELITLLTRRGARVVEAPAISIVPLADDTVLAEATRQCVAEGVDIVVATTGAGFGSWLRAADDLGLGHGLRAVLRGARLVARGPKALGAIRGAGLREAWSPDSEGSAEILDRLLAEGVAGARVAVQLHGEPLPEFTGVLRAAGASVIEVPVYRWGPPADVSRLARLARMVRLRSVDAVTFTSAPAAAALLETAGGDRDAVLEAFRTDVLPACVGSVTAGPLERLGVRTLQPERGRLGSLVRVLTERLPTHHTRIVCAAGHRLEIRGYGVVVDGVLRRLPPVPMVVLRILAADAGRVVPRSQLAAALPCSDSGHAVEMAVARLRAGIGDPAVVWTVPKRGYRLAVGPDGPGGTGDPGPGGAGRRPGREQRDYPHG